MAEIVVLLVVDPEDAGHAHFGELAQTEIDRPELIALETVDNGVVETAHHVVIGLLGGLDVERAIGFVEILVIGHFHLACARAAAGRGHYRSRHNAAYQLSPGHIGHRPVPPAWVQALRLVISTYPQSTLFRAFVSQGLVEVEGLVGLFVFVHHLADGLHHGDRIVGTEDIAAHVDAERALVNRFVSHLEGL